MVDQATVEKVIEVASQLKEQVAQLYEAYGALPPVIEREHQAIKHSAFFEQVEAARIAKEALGDRIELSFGAMMHLGETLGKLRDDIIGTQGSRPASLSDCLQAVIAISAAVGESTLAGQILGHLRRSLEQLLSDFTQRYREVKPLIEANRYLVAGMLHNIQGSLRFWQENLEKDQSYNALGQQPTTGRVSSFRASA